MDTITLQTEDGQRIEVPIIVAFGPNGKPCDLTGDIEPENCDHKGASWSPNLDIRCPRCGSRLFLPPRFLAKRTEDEIEAMHAAWARAGWPEFYGDAWSINRYWQIIEHPLFAHVGGLAVLNERLDDFVEVAP